MRRTNATPSVDHVLMTVDAVGGVWTYALDLARALGERGVRVSLAVMGPAPSAAHREELASIPTAAMHECSCALEWMDDPWVDVDRAGEWLLALERTLRPDVVHLNGYCHAGLPWQAPVLVAGHSCVLSWWRVVHAADAPAAWDTYMERVADGLRAADLVVAPTAAMLSMLAFHYGPLGRSRVISNGRYSSGRAPMPLSARDPIVLTAGRLWDPAKNVESVAAVAPHLSWPLYIAGDSRHPSGSHGADSSGAFEAVRYLGRLAPRELASWMARAAIYALPARYEPFGLSVLEAALAGCALVLGDIPSQREIWGDAALYVPPDNHRALISAIERLAHDDEFRQQLASRSRARAAELTPHRMADAYYAAYVDLLRELLPMTA
jgi:glycogen synthase